jgi:hypothetical protein
VAEITDRLLVGTLIDGRPTMKHAFVVSLLVLFCTMPCFSADKPTEFVAHNGIGFSSADDNTNSVTAFDLVEALDKQRTMVANCAEFKTVLKNVAWCFANAKNLETFKTATKERTLKNGEKSVSNKYLPFGGGYCVQGLSNGNFAEGDPLTHIVMGEDLVLNGSMEVRADFLDDASARRSAARVFYKLGLRSGLLRANSEVTH